MSIAEAVTGPVPTARSTLTERIEGWLGWLAPWILFAVVAALVVGPLGALVYGALRSDSPGAPGAHFTFAEVASVYQGLFTDGWSGRATINSLLLAVPVTILSTTVGVALAYLVARTDMPGRRTFEFLFLLPMLYSPLVGVIGWSVLADPHAGLLNFLLEAIGGRDARVLNVYSWAGIIWVMTFYFVPYAFLLNIGAFRAMDPALEEAASISGANLFRRIVFVTVPMMLASIAASAIFIFTLSLEQFSIPGFLGSQMRLDTLAYSIYQQTNMFPANLPGAAAAGTLLLFISAFSLWGYRRMTKRAEKFVTVTARGYKPAETALGRLRLVAFLFALAVFVLGAALPLLAVVLRSLMPVRTTRLNMTNLNLDHYLFIYNADNIQLSLFNSLTLAAGGATICAAAGFIIAVAVVRGRKRKATALTDYLVALPISLPGTVFGVGMLWAYVYTPLYLTVWLLLIAFVIRYTVYGVRAFSAGIMQIDRALEEAAVVSGASPTRSFLFVDLPLLKPVLVSMWLMAFLIVIRELSASVILYSPESVTLPILTWTYLSDGFYGVASALSVVQLILVGLVVIIFKALFGADVRTRSKD
ncbi:MAG: iron ABC transporter permease [Alphaproteobacteria bacterium]|nr:iron ABC transporter permease [Alphaproteobacteria bacterium]